MNIINQLRGYYDNKNFSNSISKLKNLSVLSFDQLVKIPDEDSALINKDTNDNERLAKPALNEVNIKKDNEEESKLKEKKSEVISNMNFNYKIANLDTNNEPATKNLFLNNNGNYVDKKSLIDNLHNQSQAPSFVSNAKLDNSLFQNNFNNSSNLIPSQNAILPNKNFPQENLSLQNNNRLETDKSLINNKINLQATFINPQQQINNQPNLFGNTNINTSFNFNMNTGNNNNTTNDNSIKGDNLNLINPNNNKIPEISIDIGIKGNDDKIASMSAKAEENKNSNSNISNNNISNNNEVKLTVLEKMQTASDNYFKLRQRIKEASEDKAKKVHSDLIATEVNVIINQLSTMDDIKDVKALTGILNELKRANQPDLFLFTVNFILIRLIFKCEKYKNEPKKNYLIFGKFLFELNKEIGNNIINDFFTQIIIYKCPYLAFKEFKKSDFEDIKLYRKRLGFVGDSESMTDFLSNMESYSYLFFSVIFYTMRHCSNSNNEKLKNNLKSIVSYIESFYEFFEKCESNKITYPLLQVFKTYLNALGMEAGKYVQSSTERLSKIAVKIIKHMEEQKKKQNVTSEVKSIISDSLHFIKLYLKEIKEKKITDMHR